MQLEARETEEPDGDGDLAERRLAASAVSGREPPAGPQWMRGLPLSGAERRGCALVRIL